MRDPSEKSKPSDKSKLSKAALLLADIMMDNLAKEGRIKRLQEAIDQSLDERDEQLFLVLTEQLLKEEAR